jgi:hypothetical protein
MKSVLRVSENQINVRGKLIRIARLEGDSYKFLDDPESVVDGLRKCGTRVDLFTFLQRLPETSPQYSYPMEWDNLAVLRITSFDHWWNHQLRSYPRNRARQAEKKGVVIREVPFDDTLVRGIQEVYNECPVRQGKRSRHFGKDIETIRKIEATFLDNSIFIGAFLQEKMIGFAKLVHDDTGTQANLMNFLSMVTHKDKAPTNALLAQAVKSCADRGISYLVYQKFSYGKKGSDGLTNFKEVNGFEPVDVPRYYVPLTALGRAGLSLGLHRRFVDNLPASLTKRLTELRNAWNNRKLQTTKQPL